MKKTILTITLSATFLISTTLILSSCGSTDSKEETHEHMEGEEHTEMGHEEMETADGTYACPMHPDITGVEGDKCSICKMDLKETEKNMNND